MPKLLSLTALVPLAYLVLTYLLPRLAHLILPSRWIRSIKDVTSSPADFDNSPSSGSREQPRSQTERRDRRLWILIIVGALEAVGWGAAAVWRMIETARGNGNRQEWELVAESILVALGWVSTTFTMTLRNKTDANPRRSGVILTLVDRETNKFRTTLPLQLLPPSPHIHFLPLHLPLPTPTSPPLQPRHNSNFYTYSLSIHTLDCDTPNASQLLPFLVRSPSYLRHFITRRSSRGTRGRRRRRRSSIDGGRFERSSFSPIPGTSSHVIPMGRV